MSIYQTVALAGLLIGSGIGLIIAGVVLLNLPAPNGGSSTAILYSINDGKEVPRVEVTGGGAGGDQNPGSRTQPPQEVWYKKEKP